MPDKREQPQVTVVFYYPPGSIPEGSLGDKPEGLPKKEYWRGTTNTGDDVYVASSDEFREIARWIMNHTENIPVQMGVCAVPVANIDGDVVRLDPAVHMKQQGSSQPNGGFDTIMSMVDGLDEQPAGSAVSTDNTTEDTALDTDVWFDGESPADTGTDTVVDSVDTELTPDIQHEESIVDSVDTDETPELEPTAEVGNTSQASSNSTPVDDIDDGTGDDNGGEIVDEAQKEEENRRIVTTHLVNNVVPHAVDGDLTTPLTAEAGLDLSKYPAQARVMIDTLVRQSNTLYEHSCAEARADVGYLTNEDIDREKAALVKSLMDDPTPTVLDYMEAIVHRDTLIGDVDQSIQKISDDIYRQQEEWVQGKIEVIRPHLREMFRKNMPVSEDQAIQNVLDETQPSIDNADKWVTDAQNKARGDVALRLRHQSTTGRNLSQLARLADVRATMQGDLNASIRDVIDAYQADIAEAQTTFEPVGVVDSETSGEDTAVKADSATTSTAEFGAVPAIDSDVNTPAGSDTVTTDSGSHRVDLSSLIDSEATGQTLSTSDAGIDESGQGTNGAEDTTPSELDTTVFAPADEPTEAEADADAETIIDSDNESDGADGDVNHPSEGGDPLYGGDSSTQNAQHEPTISEPSPELADNTDPTTGEDLDFTEDSEDFDHDRSTGNRIRRFFGRFGRNRGGRHSG